MCFINAFHLREKFGGEIPRKLHAVAGPREIALEDLDPAHDGVPNKLGPAPIRRRPGEGGVEEAPHHFLDVRQERRRSGLGRLGLGRRGLGILRGFHNLYVALFLILLLFSLCLF